MNCAELEWDILRGIFLPPFVFVWHVRDWNSMYILLLLVLEALIFDIEMKFNNHVLTIAKISCQGISVFLV